MVGIIDGVLELRFGAISDVSQAALELIVTSPSELSAREMGRIFEMRDPVSSKANHTLCTSCVKALTKLEMGREDGCRPQVPSRNTGPGHAGKELMCAEGRVLRQCVASRCNHIG